jgi:hypothetical protein
MAKTYEVIVASDGSIPATTLQRIGIRPGVHLHIVPDVQKSQDFEQAPRRPKSLGIGHSVRGDLSERTDELLAKGFGRS